MSTKKIVITGANGFLGRALCKEFSTSEEVEIIAIIKDASVGCSDIFNMDNVEIIKSDLSRSDDLSRAIGNVEVDSFYHFAWSGTSGSKRFETDTQIQNIKHTCDAIKLCKKIGCKKFVYASSIMELEIIDIMSKESHPPLSGIYSTAKLAAEYMGRILASQMGVDFVSGLISNVYGPGEVSQRIINTSLRKLIKREHCAFSSGEQLYDFVYIDDAARAFRAIGEKGNPGKQYYIGSFEPAPLKTFLFKMRNQVDPNIEIGLGEIPDNPASIPFDSIDIKMIKRDTNYEPQVSFEEGIRRTIRWLKETSNDWI